MSGDEEIEYIDGAKMTEANKGGPAPPEEGYDIVKATQVHVFDSFFTR